MIGAILGLLMPSPAAAAARAVRPNPYAPSLPTQASFAVGQHVRAGIRSPLSGLTGSEADAPDELASGNPRPYEPLRQAISGHAIPPSTLRPNLPADGSLVGSGTGPAAGANKGWVLLGREAWGGSARAKAPRAIASTLLSPRDRTPLPRDMATGFVAANAGRTRLEDVFDGD